MENIIMQHATIDVTYDCNLKCKLCGASSPYTPAHRRNFPFELQKKGVEKFFQFVSYVKILDICGGEVFLYKHLKEMLIYLKKYISQFDELRIVTNGTLVPHEEILNIIQTYDGKVSFIVDDYGEALSTKVAEIDSILKVRNIPHIVRNYTKNNPYCGGWVDFGDFKKRKLVSQKEAEDLFSQCAIAKKVHFCFSIIGAEMYPCQPARRCRELGVATDYDEYIDFMDTKLSLEEQQEKIRKIINTKFLSACFYCNGLCEDSKRFVPAEQLSREEMSYIYAGAASYSEILKMKESRKNNESC